MHAKQYIFYKPVDPLQEKDVAVASARITSGVLLKKAGASFTPNVYYQPEKEYRLFMDVQPKDAMQEWLASDREVEIYLLHSIKEIREIQELFEKKEIVCYAETYNGMNMLSTEPIFDNIFKDVYNERKTLLKDYKCM